MHCAECSGNEMLRKATCSQSSASTTSASSIQLLSCSVPEASVLNKVLTQSEDARGEIHALGKMEGRDGATTVKVQFLLSDDSQAGNLAGTQRCSHHSFLANTGASPSQMPGAAQSIPCQNSDHLVNHQETDSEALGRTRLQNNGDSALSADEAKRVTGAIQAAKVRPLHSWQTM